MNKIPVTVCLQDLDILPALLSLSSDQRLELARQLWPTDVKEGDLFTLVCHMRDGVKNNDGSWVGQTLRADYVEGPYIVCSLLNSFTGRYEPMGGWNAVVGTNCQIRRLTRPLHKSETQEMYRRAKNN